ncbi:MAG: phenylalanine--tRNA ligase subunit alpha, partial [Clostridia bacterium]|nr:phenylalanine--tRNA ligase subunit alpha [Clostridia bacterium]
MKEKLEAIKQAAVDAVQKAVSEKDIEDLRVSYLGKKGELTAILKQMGGLSPEERPKMGQLVNDAKSYVEELVTKKREELKAKATELKLKAETIDITMPAKTRETGKLHPLNTVLDDMIDIFQSMGFDVLDGPEVETDHYNFECLNVPADHPARDMQDT